MALLVTRSKRKCIWLHLGMTGAVIEKLRDEDGFRLFQADELADLCHAYNDILNAGLENGYAVAYEYRENDCVFIDNLAVAHRAAPEAHMPVEQQGLRIMKTLQKKFGGTFRHVRDTELQRANQFFRDISERVAGQYIVQFETDDLDSEETHTLQINVNHQGKPIESVPTEFQPPPVEGTPWWVWLLRIGGALCLGEEV